MGVVSLEYTNSIVWTPNRDDELSVSHDPHRFSLQAPVALRIYWRES